MNKRSDYEVISAVDKHLAGMRTLLYLTCRGGFADHTSSPRGIIKKDHPNSGQRTVGFGLVTLMFMFSLDVSLAKALNS